MPRRLSRRRGRRGGGGRRRGPRSQVHTLSYSGSFAIDKREGTRNLLVSHFDIPTSRCCRVRSITMRYSSAKPAGTCFSYTIESQVSADDATCRSPPLLITPFPSRYTLRNPRSSDFAYLNNTAPLCDITLYNSLSANPEDLNNFFLATIVIEFMPMQPMYKDLGVLPFPDDEHISPDPSDLSLI